MKKVVKKSSFVVAEEDKVRVEEHEQYVSRSAHKLSAFLKELELDLSAGVALDIGSSTGGFTQVFITKWC